MLNGRSSLPLQISEYPTSRFVSFLYFYTQRASFLPTVVQVYQFRYLRSRHTEAEIACRSAFITFIHKDNRFYTQLSFT